MKILILGMLLVLVGCGDSGSDRSTEAAAPQEDRETVFDPMVSSIDKAKQVEQQIFDQKKQMDDALSKMEGEPE
jgi:hypothetical protein